MARRAVVALVLALALGAHAGTNDGQYCYDDAEVVRGAFNTDLGACLCDIGFSSSGAFGANCDVPSTCSTPATTDPLFVDSAVQSFVVDLAGSNLEVTTEVTMAENRRLNKLTVGTLPTCGYPVDHYVYNTVGGQCWDTVGVTVPVNSLEECGFLPTVNATHKSYTGYVNMQFAERFQTPRGFTIERLVSSQAEVEVTLPVLVQSSSVPLTVASAVNIEAVLTEFDYTSQPGFLRVRLSTNVQEPYQLTFKDMFVPNSLGFSVPQADACTETPCTQDFVFLVDLEGGQRCNVDGNWDIVFTPSCVAGYDCTGTLPDSTVTANINVGSICRSVTVVNGVSAHLDFYDTQLASASSPTIVPNQWFELVVTVNSTVEVASVDFVSLTAEIDGSLYQFFSEGQPIGEVTTLGEVGTGFARVSIRFSEDMAATIFETAPDSSRQVTLVAQVAVSYGSTGVNRRRDIRATKLTARRSITITVDTNGGSDNGEEGGDDSSAAGSAPTVLLGASVLAAAAAVMHA